MTDVQADFFATLVDEWARNGITDAVVSPGNRSTLLASLLDEDERIAVHVVVDERSASFFALGLARATGRAPLVWTTSGTATTELHAAVVEAHHDKVPVLFCTADRPPELLHGRDWQAIDQSRLYEGLLRWQFDPGVAQDAVADQWRSIACRAVTETRHGPHGPGPVHLNLPIREPWSYPGTARAGRKGSTPWHLLCREVREAAPDVGALVGKRGLLVAGHGAGPPDLVLAAADALGWPLLADMRSGCRRRGALAAGEWLSPAVFPERLRPEVVVHLGTPLISKTFAQWCHRIDADHWIVDPHDDWFVRSVGAHSILRVSTTGFLQACSAAVPGAPDQWKSSWESLGRAVQDLYDQMPVDGVHEPALARDLVALLPDDSQLFVATSMPVRDVETFGAPRSGLQVHANRGASGMDGMISTAAGVAVGSQQTTALLCGDLSFLYDIGALWSLKGAARAIDLVMVVVDNGGGGIFAGMKQLAGIDAGRVERVAITPQREDIGAVAASFGVGVRNLDSLDQLPDAFDGARADGGMQLIHVVVDRTRSAVQRSQLEAAVRDLASRF